MEAEPVISWITENRKLINGLEALLGDVRKVEKSNEHRHYAFKTDVLECFIHDGKI